MIFFRARQVYILRIINRKGKRGASSLMVRNVHALAWSVVALVFGVMVSVQYHDVVMGGAAFWSSSPDVASVETRLSAVESYNEHLRQQIDLYSQKVSTIQTKAIARGGKMASLERDIHAMNVLNGTMPLIGPGIEVVISDSKMSKVDRVAFLTHDWDLRSVINELFIAGADAVVVNNARITAQTGVFCIGPVVRVGNVRLGPPFIVKAIGPASVLAAALEIPGGVLDVLKSANRELFVSQPRVLKRVQIPSYSPALVAVQGAGTQ